MADGVCACLLAARLMLKETPSITVKHAEVTDVLGFDRNFTVPASQWYRCAVKETQSAARCALRFVPWTGQEPLPPGSGTKRSTRVRGSGGPVVIDKQACWHFTDGTCDASCPFALIDFEQDEQIKCQVRDRGGHGLRAHGGTCRTAAGARLAAVDNVVTLPRIPASSNLPTVAADPTPRRPAAHGRCRRRTTAELRTRPHP